MFDNLWRTFGFGSPVTVAQMLGRGAICIALAIGLIAVGNTTTVFDWLFIVMLTWGSGLWVGKVLGWVDDKLLVEATENVANMLKPVVARTPVLEPELDYVVNPGEPCWMTVGNYSVRVLQNDNGGASVQVYHLNREDEEAITKLEV